MRTIDSMISAILRPALMILGCMVSAFAGAQQFPTKPVRIVTPLSIGSQTDILGRMVAPKLSESWQQPVIVDNRPGGAGAIAGSILVKSSPDGHTLMIYSDGHAVNAALNSAMLPFDTVRDISRVILVASMPAVLVVGPSLGARSVKELIAAAKQQAGQFSFGSAGVGGGLHFSGEMFRLAAGIDAVHVPFKGTPEALAETMTGRIQFMFSSPGPALPLIKSNRLRALAVSSPERSAAFPGVPTVAEAGLPGFEYELWQGLFAPAKTPRTIIDQINRDVARIMLRPDIQEQLQLQSLIHRPNTAAEFEQFVRAEIQKLSKIVTVAGLKLQ